MNKVMSEKGSKSNKEEQAPDLSALDFGPSWARADKGSSTKGNSRSGSASESAKSPRSRKGGQRGDSRGNSRGREAKGHGRDGGRHSGKDNRHGGAGRDHRGGAPKGRGRGDFSKGDREQRHVVAAPEGVKARIMPIEEGLDAMAKQISATGRTHSVFDLAWLVLGSLDRFHVVFESDDQPLYRSESDHSVWQTKKECVAHLLSSGLIAKYYDEEMTEVDPPSGNFQSVARCGMSKKLIGPPNHHGYQQALLDLHRERFSSMPIERYKSKIIMEHGEEAVQEWLDAMSKHKRWRPKKLQSEEVRSEEVQSEEKKSGEEEPSKEKSVEAITQEDEVPTPAEAVAPADTVASADTVAPAEVEVQAEESGAEGETVQDEAEIAASEEAQEAEASEPDVEAEPEAEVKAEESVESVETEETAVILDNHREVEQHFLEHGFEKEFYQGKAVSALANIPPKMISAGLMTLLRTTVAEEKRYPGNLASILCRQMSGRHLAVYKWKKRLHCGPARPRHVSKDLVMADRPGKMFQWVADHAGGNIDELWKECLPAEIDEATRHTWYHDLHWLINEGLVLLLSDGTLHAAKEQGDNEAQSKQAGGKKKAAKKKVAKKAAKKAANKADLKPELKTEVKDDGVAAAAEEEAKSELESTADQSDQSDKK